MEGRRGLIVMGHAGNESSVVALRRYMCWYRPWTSLYMLKAHVQPLDTYYPAASAERALREHFLEVEELFQPFFGRDENTATQLAFNKYEELCSNLRRCIHISDTRYGDVVEEELPSTVAGYTDDVGAGPSIYADLGPSSNPWSYPQQVHFPR